MDVRIGVTHIMREIEVELPEGVDADKVTAQIEESVTSGAGMLWLTDRRGRRIGVPAAKLAYIEIDADHDERRVGFGAAVR